MNKNAADASEKMEMVKKGFLTENMSESPVQRYERRDCYPIIPQYLYHNEAGKVLLLYGLRRTGKTTMNYKYFFIDEITLMKDFIDSASLFFDVHAMQGCKFVLLGTDPF